MLFKMLFIYYHVCVVCVHMLVHVPYCTRGGLSVFMCMNVCLQVCKCISVCLVPMEVKESTESVSWSQSCRWL